MGVMVLWGSPSVSARMAFPASQTEDGQRPLDNACGYIPKAGEGEGRFDRGAFHGEGIAPALEVVMGQDGAADDRQVGIGAYKIMGELAHKIQQLLEAGPVNFHGGVLGVEADAMFIIVYIRGILQKPSLPVDGEGDGAVVLPGRVVGTPCIALIFRAELAAGPFQACSG